MRKTTIVACVLILSAPVAMAQGLSEGNMSPKAGGVQEAMAPMSADEQARRTFILDEFGRVYDSRGDLITPRRAKK